MMHIDSIWDVENYNRQRDREKARKDGAKAERERIRKEVMRLRRDTYGPCGQSQATLDRIHNIRTAYGNVLRILDAKEAE